MAKDYYETLGVPKTATEAEIKTAYRKMAHQHHPDKQGGDEAKFKEVNEAYQTLSNKDKRAKYDQFGRNYDGSQGFNWQDFARQQGASSGYSTNVNFEDMGFGDIGDIFGDLFGMGGRSRRQATDYSGNDVEAAIELDFREAVFGTNKTLNLQKTVTCSRCRGNTAEPGTKIESCSQCGGTGQVERLQNTVLGQIRTRGICPKCAGVGKIPVEPCHQCHGQGIIRDHQKLEVKIPAGIDDGQTIRLSGQGEAGQHGASAGDLFLRIRVGTDPRFARERDTIRTAAEITISTAVLGGTVSVETIDGEVDLKIPAGTPSGRVFKLKERGVPKLNSRGRGDQLVTVSIRVPQHASKKVKKIMEELEEEGE
ncbi:MAG: molecular chaperone DnaJ [Patescibacteria group bacterium]|jgi:molecular chaperone DnaJ